MKLVLALPIALAAGCAYYPTTWKTEMQEYKAQVRQRATYPDDDKVSRMMLTCDQLGFPRGSDGHRLCMMRGADRYIDHQTPPLSERYLRRDDDVTVRVPQVVPVPTVPVDPCCYPQPTP